MLLLRRPDPGDANATGLSRARRPKLMRLPLAPAQDAGVTRADDSRRLPYLISVRGPSSS